MSRSSMLGSYGCDAGRKGEIEKRLTGGPRSVALSQSVSSSSCSSSTVGVEGCAIPALGVAMLAPKTGLVEGGSSEISFPVKKGAGA